MVLGSILNAAVDSLFSLVFYFLCGHRFFYFISRGAPLPDAYLRVGYHLERWTDKDLRSLWEHFVLPQVCSNGIVPVPAATGTGIIGSSALPPGTRQKEVSRWLREHEACGKLAAWDLQASK